VAGGLRDSPSADWKPFRWSTESGFQVINIGGVSATATNLSGDGQVVVGATVNYDMLGPLVSAFYWTADDGVKFFDAASSTHHGNRPTGVSFDGGVIVGTSYFQHSALGYRWTAETGTTALNIPPGFSDSVATDVSADGNIVIGQALVNTANSWRYFFPWGQSPILFEWNGEALLAQVSHATSWTPTNGTQLLLDVLKQEYGLADELNGWALISASAISANGRVIAGVGVNPAGAFQGWVAIIPEPSSFLLVAILVSQLVLVPGRKRLEMEHGSDHGHSCIDAKRRRSHSTHRRQRGNQFDKRLVQDLFISQRVVHKVATRHDSD
jgi:uncharacterized membrane protein